MAESWRRLQSLSWPQLCLPIELVAFRPPQFVSTCESSSKSRVFRVRHVIWPLLNKHQRPCTENNSQRQDSTR